MKTVLFSLLQEIKNLKIRSVHFDVTSYMSCVLDLLCLHSFAKIILIINFMDTLQNMHGLPQSNEGTSKGQKEDQPRGENAIGSGVGLVLH